ncbi:MAG: DUF853 family protein [Bacteroidales bacterium]|nr:DUF853 family protein [Bacteroidales bacterium]
MLTNDNKLYVAHCENGPIYFNPKMANRHGLITGATGTGKTVSLQVLAETFSQAGIPCFMADMKGDLSGASQAGCMNGFIEKRCVEFGVENPSFQPCPVRFFDVFGEQGHPMRASISSMGPALLSRILELNPTQEGVLNIIFNIADDENLPLIDLKDIRMMLNFVSEHVKQYIPEYGNMTNASIGAIQRGLLTLENDGCDKFFGEPEFNIQDLLDVEDGKGVLSILAADKLMLHPKVYSTFLLWLLSELYENLPEVGDLDKPKLVFFFDEAHMLFDDTSKAMINKVEQVIRLIRSKGVGVYFITQNPADVPEIVLGQLANKVQHALRAFTPKDQKAVKAAAQSFRANPKFDTAEAITNLSTGEALVSFLDEKGAPEIVQRAKMLFPLSSIGAITPQQRRVVNAGVPDKIIVYDEALDSESAYEMLMEIRKQQETIIAEASTKEVEATGSGKSSKDIQTTSQENGKGLSKKAKRGLLGTVVGAAATSFLRTTTTQYVRNATSSKKKSGKKIMEQAATNAASSAARTVLNTALKGLFG